MRAWETFYPYVLPEVLGCPEPTVDLALVSAAREFCGVTKCWRADLAAIPTLLNTPSYALVFDANVDGHTIINADLEGDELDLDVPDATSLTERRRGTGGRRRLRTVDMRTVTLIPTPAAGLNLRIEAICKPSESAANFAHDATADRYRREIARGALAELLNMNKQPWTNNVLAADLRKKFERDMGRVKSITWKGHTNSRPSHSGQFF